MGRNVSFREIKFIDKTRDTAQNYNKVKKKRQRTKLTDDQIRQLELIYAEEHHPSNRVKIELSEIIGIPIKNIQIWFQNRRAKDRIAKENQEEEECDNEEYDKFLMLVSPKSNNSVYESEFRSMPCSDDNRFLKDNLRRINSLSNIISYNNPKGESRIDFDFSSLKRINNFKKYDDHETNNDDIFKDSF